MTSYDPPAPPLLHRLIAAGHLRYWLIGSWALALCTSTGPVIAVWWFAVACTAGLARTVVDRRATGWPRLAIATLSCAVWAMAPLLSLVSDSRYGVEMGVGLLMAGYVLVFTQIRAAPKEALLVSSPYSAVVLALIVSQHDSPSFWVLLAVLPVLGLALMIKVVITQIKDEELRAVNRRQAALITDLEFARDQAQAASVAKSNFLAVISHELRTPMNGVLGAAELLRMSGLNPRQAGFVDIVTQSGDTLMGLLNDILDTTRIETGQIALTKSLVPIDGLLERLIGPFAGQAETRALTFTAERQGEWPVLARMDSLRLAQIVGNMLGNAIKFTPQGRVALVMSGSRHVDGRLALRIAVSDSGIGISPEAQARLFQPFALADESSTRRFDGAGLGLSLSQRLAALMDGRITVDSTPGKGSTFTLEILVDTPEWTSVSPSDQVAA